MCNPKISIIVPVYNSGKYIKNTIDSILNQSIKDLELILVNDGSTDNSGQIIDDYKKQDSRIKVIHQENKGVSCARNNGISIAQGEYLGFIDSDDMVDLNMYSMLYEVALKSNSDIVCSGFVEEDTQGNIYRNYSYPYPDIVLVNDEIKQKVVSHLDNHLELIGGGSMCTKIYKRSFIKNNGLSINEDITVGEDFCFNIEALYFANNVTGVASMPYHYMSVNPNSIMTKLDDKKLLKFIDGRKHILKTLEKYNFSSKNYTAFEYSRNFGNLIQIVDYKISNLPKLSEKYSTSINLLKSKDIKYSISQSDNKYLSKNLQLLKFLIKSHLYPVVFLILYLRNTIKK